MALAALQVSLTVTAPRTLGTAAWQVPSALAVGMTEQVTTGLVVSMTVKQAAEARLSLCSRHVEVRNQTCLEIGCATGEFCEVLRSHGARVVGLDLASVAIAQARLRYPLIEFREGDLAAIQSDEQMDLIFAFELIEHVDSPAQFLSSVASHLKPGGRLILTTPNYNCGRRVGVDRWSGFQSSLEHLYFFNSQSVSRYATKVGLMTEASLTGNGDGIHIEPGFDVKEPVRKVLGKVGVLDLVRRYRSRGSWQSPDAEYSRDDDLHSLFVVLGKPGDPSLQLRGTPS